ncbi:universal stress protein [Streptomyces rishiriensis]|uniref:Nucleotide-binding universal stress UspA family protein n=1 Tax=Streptomyces rishiriensis TaxID=68264 RepID=A0ABU0P0G8_STRRH|nr:universal stress protein [Streptomyces rishiriensis]MDQ0584885.1 nucleotide-binding universal stress UspA family protein [Streptomyces rishiriensis]
MSESRPSPAPRVVVGVSGSLGSLTALGRAADEARRRGAELWPVLAWEPPGGQLAARRSTAAAVLVEDWERLARERLLGALREAFGGGGHGLRTRALVARGAPGPALVATADREDDLLVIGAGRRGLLQRALWPSTGRYCLAHASCPVLAVPPSPLEAALVSARRRNAWGLRMDTGHVAREFDTVPPDA